MPIYEFYCPDCHTVFSFFSARIDTEARPDCPRCERAALTRKPSRFATLKSRGEEEAEDDPFAGLDESKMEGAMETLMREMDGVENEEDPRAMGRMMRRFGELSGLEMGDRMEDMVRRMEAGEDPESLEDEMGDDAESDDFEDFFRLKKAVAAGRRRRPQVDEELYFL
ncbi:MAG: zinc ribbon domain-containing protein [bacterium]|nr:zinc ribbon domain-containing protein [bacterium]